VPGQAAGTLRTLHLGEQAAMLKDEAPSWNAAASNAGAPEPSTPPARSPAHNGAPPPAGLPSSSLAPKSKSRSSHDEPSADDVLNAMVASPRCAPTSTASPMTPECKANYLLVRQASSPRRATPLGQTNHHATPWHTTSFELDCPYGQTTTDSRFADVEADKAALWAVAHTAGRPTAAPVAGMSSAKHRAIKELPSLRREVTNGALP
jgi:hypothetical protein